MPRVDTSKDGAIKPYGVGENANQKLFQDRLLGRFKPHEYVRVTNVDNETFIWQYMPAENEDEQYTPDGMHRHIYRNDPEVWMLEPGESEVIIGANAYIMIESLYKKIMSKKVLEKPNPNPAIARKFNFADPTQAEQWINEIYNGKEVLEFQPSNKVVTTDESSEPEAVRRGPGRPARQTA